MRALTAGMKSWPGKQPLFFLVLAGVAWLALYQTLDPVSAAMVGLLPVDPDGHLGGALQFFFYDTPKVLLLLTGIVFVMGIIHTWISPEHTRALLSGRRLGVGNAMAASLGIVTPFCSCSAVPLAHVRVLGIGGARVSGLRRGGDEPWRRGAGAHLYAAVYGGRLTSVQ